MPPSHTDREYGARLDELRERLVNMSRRVEGMISSAVRAVIERDDELARTTILEDDIIDLDEMATDELCLLILARWQPMASDLRFVLTALKMVTNLERMGDLAVNVSERAIDLNKLPPLVYQNVPVMADIVKSMVRDAVQSFMDRDTATAHAVMARDDEVDALYVKVFRTILETMERDSESVHRGIHVQSIAKYLERIADHATNIAEETVFLVAGDDVRHRVQLARDEES